MNAILSHGLDEFTVRLVRRKAGQLVRRPGFSPSDRADVEQSLYVRVLGGLRSFDPHRAHRNSFVTAVVERHVATILRDRAAIKRDHRRISSLNVTINVANEGPTELIQTIGSREAEARLGARRRSERQHAEVVDDLATAIASLPAQLRDLAERLKRQTLTEISRETGIPRSTLNDCLGDLRRRFEQSGLREYLSI